MRPRSWPLVLAAIACAGPAQPSRTPERVDRPLAFFGIHAWCVTDGPRGIFCERREIPAVPFDPYARSRSCTEAQEPVAELRIYDHSLLVRTASGRVLEGEVPSSDGAFALHPVVLPSPARAIGAGMLSCAATEADGVLCWSAETGPPTRVTGIGLDVRELVVAGLTACVIEGDGDASCWGSVAGEWLDSPRTIFRDARSLALAGDGRSVCATVGARRRLFCLEALIPNRVDVVPPREVSYGVVDGLVEQIEQVLMVGDASVCVVTSGALYCTSATLVDEDPLRTAPPRTRLLPMPPIGPIFERIRALDSEARVVSVGYGVCVLEHGEARCSTDPAGALEQPRSCRATTGPGESATSPLRGAR